MNNICENFKQIIINSMEDIKNLKNKTIQKSDNSFVSEGDLLVQKLIADEIKKNTTTIILYQKKMTTRKNGKNTMILSF